MNAKRVTIIAATLACAWLDAASSPAADVFAGKRAGGIRSDNELKMKLCWCPPGKFTMGSAPGRPFDNGDEGPVKVTLTRGFWLGKFEVTQAEWESVMGTTVKQQARLAKSRFLAGVGPNHPMYFVSHHEATEFCAKLTGSERAAGRLTAAEEYRLPTEAQWEYACRAGKDDGEGIDPVSSTKANFDGSLEHAGITAGPNLGETVRVGSYTPNDWGLCDMYGNVFEWCRDGYFVDLPGGNDPDVTKLEDERVRRGGAWRSAGELCRSAYRRATQPDQRDEYCGFRVVLVQTGD